MPDLSKGTALVQPTQGFSTQDYEQAKFRWNNGTVSVRVTGDGATGTAGTASSIPVIEQFAPGYEDNVNSLAAVLQKPVASSIYSPSDYTSFGAATGGTIKSTAGNVYSVYVTSGTTAIRYFQLHNGTAVPANGGTPVASYPMGSVAAGGLAVLDLPSTHFAPSKYFSSGIAWAMSSTNGTLGTASVTAADVTVHIKYV